MQNSSINFLEKTKFNKLIIGLIIVILTFITRIAVAPSQNGYSSYDSGNFILATHSFSIQDDKPHLPGYYLFVVILKYTNLIIHNFYYSMLFLSVLFTSIASVLIFLLLDKYFEKLEAILLTLIIIFNPLVWFYSSSTEIYAFDLFFSALVFYIGLQKNGMYILPLLIALGTGVRQTTGLLLLPLCFYFFYRKLKEKDIDWLLLGTSIVPSLLAFAIWFVPMTNSIGGVHKYIEYSTSNSPIPQGLITKGLWGFARNLAGMFSYGFFGLIPSIISLIILLFYKIFRKKNQNVIPTEEGIPVMMKPGMKINSQMSILKYQLLYWLVPPILFFMVIHYAKGYLLLVFPFIFVIPAYLIIKKILNIKSLILILIIQILVFLFYPYYYPSYEDNSNYDYRKLSKLETSLNRFVSYYGMSYSHLKRLGRFYKEIDTLLNDKNFPVSKRAYIFVDPSVVPNHRILQIIYPDRTFLKLNQTEPDSYVKFSGTNFYYRDDFESILGVSVILTSNSYYNRFLRNFSGTSLSTKNFTIFIPTNKNIGEIAGQYMKFFNRVGY